MKCYSIPAGAEFASICRDPRLRTPIGQVDHKTYVDVNEEDTEAAAATSGVIELGGIPRPIDMTVDHPFFVAIRDDQTGALVFTGAVFEP